MSAIAEEDRARAAVDLDHPQGGEVRPWVDRPDIGQRLVVRQAGASLDRITEAVDAAPVASLLAPAPALAAVLLAARTRAPLLATVTAALVRAGPGRPAGRAVPLVPTLIRALAAARLPGRVGSVVVGMTRIALFLPAVLFLGVHRCRSSRSATRPGRQFAARNTGQNRDCRDPMVQSRAVSARDSTAQSHKYDSWCLL